MNGCHQIHILACMMDCINDPEMKNIGKLGRMIFIDYDADHKYYIPQHVYDHYHEEIARANLRERIAVMEPLPIYLPDLHLEVKEDKKFTPWYITAGQKGGSKKRKPFIK